MVVPIGKLLPGAKPLVSAMDPPAQLSVKVGAVHVAVAVQEASAFTLMLLGQPAITGTVTSVTVTVKEQLTLLPAASVTSYVTVFTPTGKVLPLARPAVRAVVTPAQLSVPTGAV